MARKNMHGKVGVKFKAPWTASKEKNMMRNVTTELVKFGEVTVTEHVASELKKTADHMITLAKKNTLASRRQAARYLRDITVDKEGTTALQKLFNELGPRFANRNGGYTRALKLENRTGDNSPMCVVKFVD